jgi:DNA-binding IclR family transcriptional regulator
LEEKLSKKNLSVGKVLQIIEIMAKNPGPMNLQDISLQLSMPASTVIRYLSTLIENGYAQQNEDSLKYRLTLKISHVSEMVKSQFRIRDIVRPYLINLNRQYKESTCLAIEENMAVVYIDVVEGSDHLLQSLHRIGKTAPLHCTGVGKLMLLAYNSDQLDRLIAEKGLTSFTQNTINTKEHLIEELDTIRKQGVAFDSEECEIGVCCIAAPIKDYDDHTIACISISGPVSRMDKNTLQAMKLAILETANQISKVL